MHQILQQQNLYNGTSWTSSNPTSINTARGLFTGCGTQTAALGFGGSAPLLQQQQNHYNGSTWTSVNSYEYWQEFFRWCRNSNSWL
jgi:hypothetical protein